MLLGVLAFKPQYAVPILLVATLNREWRIVIGSAATFASMTLVSGLSFGFDQWTAFLGAATQSVSHRSLYGELDGTRAPNQSPRSSADPSGGGAGVLASHGHLGSCTMGRT